MTDFASLIQQGAAHAWLFIPSAILLGALHGLEPGHSKTMMAAFIIAIGGTMKQAVLLGLAATLSHTLVVWGIALTGMYLWRGLDTQAVEPYFQLLSAAAIITIALWMAWRTWRDQHVAHDHHHHGEAARRIDTGHGAIALSIVEEGVPPRWHLATLTGAAWAPQDVSLETTRPDGGRQVFSFRATANGLESHDVIPEPHAFEACLTLSHGGHSHRYDLRFTEEDHSHHDHGDAPDDAHARAHAADIARRFGGRREVTTWQVVGFGLTGGLIPCPAAITVLLLCLQLKQIPLGAVLVLCFSIGLALTLVSVGVSAAFAVRHAGRRLSWFNGLSRRAPYFSSGLIILVGLYVAWSGWMGLAGT